MAVSSPPRPPAQDDPDALIPEARDRQRRRRLLALATFAIAVVLGLGFYGAATGGGPLGAVRGSLGLGGTPKICRSSQLKTHPVFGGFGLPVTDGGVLFTNTSGSACSLPVGTPRVSLFWHGQRLAVRQVHVADYFRMFDIRGINETPAAHVLGPSKIGWIEFRWLNWCGPPKVPTVPPVTLGPPKVPIRRDVTLSFRFGKTPVVSLQIANSAKCTQPGAPSTIAATQPLLWPS